MKGQDRKKQILEAAKRICSKKGFSGTKLNDIAKESGVSRTLVVQHFGSKEGLYESLIDFLFKEHPLEADIEIKDKIQKKDDFEVFYSFFLHIFYHMTKDKESSPLKLVFFSLLEKSDLYEKHYQKRVIKGLKILEDYIYNRIKEGSFKEINPQRVVSFFVASIMYLILQHLTFPKIIEEDEVKETVREAINLLIEGIKSKDTYEDLAKFHGHSCIGLAIGYRVANIVLKNGFKRAYDEELIAIVENDSCSVDAIQFFLGCTFGKGNLYVRDYGKHVITVIERDTGRAIRISLNLDVLDFNKKSRDKILKNILQLPEDKLFKIDKFIMKEDEIPKRAEIRASVACSICGEPVMETKTRKINGKVYCIPCSSNLISSRGDGV